MMTKNDIDGDDLLKIIHKRLNYEYDKSCERGVPIKYDGFDMSGYGTSHICNLEVLSRFRDMMSKSPSDNIREIRFFIPIFWKGSGYINELIFDGNGDLSISKNIMDVSGLSSASIILHLIRLNTK